MNKELDDIINDWIKNKDNNMEQEGYGFDNDYQYKDLSQSEDYSFTMFDGTTDREVIHNIRMSSPATYNEVIEQFAEFLSSVYGYPIKIKAYK